MDNNILSFTEYLKECSSSVIEPAGTTNTEKEEDTEKVITFDEFKNSDKESDVEELDSK